MDGFDIFQDVARRTGGDVYLGVVGPVRAGKSTFVKRFMELLILPSITDPYERERTSDELPQSGAGRTVMTTEPKFVPDQAVAVSIGGGMEVRVRLVDSVGFPVSGALGYAEDGGPRMVVTPWFDYEIPFEEAAEVGTRKVIADHSTLGVVVTADGSFGDLPRDSFAEAEERPIRELQSLGKPFLVLLNCAHPTSAASQNLAADLEAQYGVRVLPVNCTTLDEDGFGHILAEVLYEFPVRDFQVDIPDWVSELDSGHWLRRRFDGAVSEATGAIHKLRDVEAARQFLDTVDVVDSAEVSELDLGSGAARIGLTAREDLFQQVIQEITGIEGGNRAGLVRLLRELVYARAEYERIADALREVQQVGYGVVTPDFSDITFEEPEMVRKGNQFGVRLRAKAPSLHFIRADLDAEYTPLLGNESQSEDLVNYLTEKFEDDPQKIWDSQILGRSLHDLLREGIRTKLSHMPENAQQKLRETVQRIVNEGSGGLICIIL